MISNFLATNIQTAFRYNFATSAKSLKNLNYLGSRVIEHMRDFIERSFSNFLTINMQAILKKLEA